MLEDAVKRKLESNVADFYEKVGAAFSSTRHAPWDLMRLLAERVKAGERVVDVGAGNGRLAEVLPPGVEYLGIEPSAALRSSSAQVIVPGALPKLDLPDAQADAVACIAVLHHVPSAERRTAAVAELHRILKPGGWLLCTVWNLRSSRFRGRKFLSWRAWLAAWLRVPGFAGAEPGDAYLSWRAEGENELRYVHAFTLGGFKRLFPAKDWAMERFGAYDRGEWQPWTKGRNLVVLARRR